MSLILPRFLCRPTAYLELAVAVIRCFAYGKSSDVQRQQQDVNSHRTAEESRTSL